MVLTWESGPSLERPSLCPPAHAHRPSRHVAPQCRLVSLHTAPHGTHRTELGVGRSVTGPESHPLLSHMYTRESEVAILGPGWKEMGVSQEEITASLGFSRYSLPPWALVPPGQPGAPALPPGAVSG